jgi:glycosyltransferase involved in cell wall biosynthesis
MKVLLPLINDVFHSDSNWIAATYYIKNLLNALASQDDMQIPEHIILLPDTIKNDLILPEFESNASWITWKYLSKELIALDKVLEFDKFLETLDYDVVLNLNNFPMFGFRGGSIAWIPDFQHIRLSEYFSSDEIEERDRHFELQAVLSDAVILSSNDSKADFKNLFPTYENKAQVYQFASILAKEYFELDPSKTLEKFNIAGDFIYLPNQFWKHKNHRCVFEAWKILRDQGTNIPLILTGAKNDYRFPEYQVELDHFIEANNLSSSVHYLGFISREDQIQLYRAASFLLQPSLFEGWSTSIEDAKAVGLPVIASDFSVHLEQVPEGVFFSSKDPVDLALHVERAWQSRKSFTFRNLNESYKEKIKTAANGYLQALDRAYESNSLSQRELRRYSNLMKRKNLIHVRRMETVLKNEIRIREGQISNLFLSANYRLGNLFLSPLRKIRSIFRKPQKSVLHK